MKKNRLILIALLSSSLVYGQGRVGVNTDNPQVELDVNGDIRLRNELRVGLNTDDEISAGKAGQVLLSQGSGLPPIWGDINPPRGIAGEYVLKSTLFKEDRLGLNLNNEIKTGLTEGMSLNGDWSLVPGLSEQITVSKAANRILITMQTMVQSDFNGDPKKGIESSAKIICGIFVDNKLRSARFGSVIGAHYPQIVFTVISSFDDIPVGTYNLNVAFQRRESSVEMVPFPIHIGQAAFSTSNNFMNKSILRVDVFETSE